MRLYKTAGNHSRLFFVTIQTNHAGNTMLRRKFIKHTMAGLPIAASFLSDACSPKERIDPKTKSVIVVGAGISGLAAARQLHEQGFTVIVLEAQDRVGGRLRTNRSASVAFDEGASWIHGIDGNPITALAQQAGMQTAWTDDESRKSYDHGGIVRKAAVYDAAEEELYTILDSLMKRGSSSQSFETVFMAAYPAKTGDRLWTFFLSTNLTFDTGDLNNLSSLLYNEGEEYAGVERIAVNGYDTIPAYLANGLPVLLNQRVTAIDYRTSTVQVTHNGTVSEADFVIVTVPLGVLKGEPHCVYPSPACRQTRGHPQHWHELRQQVSAYLGQSLLGRCAVHFVHAGRARQIQLLCQCA